MLLIGVLLGIAGQFVSEPLLMLINTPENIIGQAAEYLRIYFAGVPFLMIYDFGSAVLRSKGDSRRPLAALMISGVINLLATTFTSQNYAAGNIKRCRRIFAVCLVLATAFSAVMCLSLTALRYQASGLFTRSQAEIEYACERILIVLCLQPICSLYEIPAWTMRGLGTH